MNTNLPMPVVSVMPDVTAAFAPVGIALMTMVLVAVLTLFLGRDGRRSGSRARRMPAWLAASLRPLPRRMAIGLLLALGATAASAHGGIVVP
ncbi:MAG TPA: hypothetical protein VGR62_23590 [Candidatus Binatia bacterium]|jgi:hypothetical protein|nr:hypothetical protein [Candidatus Binatia bacterium]